MKKTIYLVLPLAIFITSCSNNKKESPFALSGKLLNSKGETLYLEKLENPQPTLVDSAKIDEAGNFLINNCKPKLGFYRLKINQQNFAMLVLDSADKIELSGNAADLGNTYSVKGSPETQLFLEYNDLVKNYRKRSDSLVQYFNQTSLSLKLDSVRRDSFSKVLQKPYTEMTDNYFEIVSKKIMANTDKFSSIMAIQGLDPEKYTKTYKALDNGLYKRFPSEPSVLKFHEVVQRMSSSTVGEEAPEIKLPNPDGKEIALSSFRGKIVLIDFWASWCGPCVKEMPNVKTAYEKYKNKGFEVYGVSLDMNKENWVAKIKSLGITWTQVSDLKQWDCEPARIYGVQAIPFTVLIDKDGKIIEKNLRGEALEAKLAELFK
ncbi:MAG: redoxin domain-containing protein [Bacteroidetes bacterium]|nr:redoxin domain-containing protein [Bacteroidota bacterium]